MPSSKALNLSLLLSLRINAVRSGDATEIWELLTRLDRLASALTPSGLQVRILPEGSHFKIRRINLCKPFICTTLQGLTTACG